MEIRNYNCYSVHTATHQVTRPTHNHITPHIIDRYTDNLKKGTEHGCIDWQTLLLASVGN